MIKSLAAAAALVVFASSSMAAGAIDVSADIYLGGNLDGVATFAGTDANSDGKLSLSELSSFSISIEGYNASLADVNAFGTYSIASNTWNADAEAWGGTYPTGSFVTWDDQDLAVTTWSGFSVTTTATSPVPEPTSLLMMSMGMGALALAARRRKSA